MQISKLLKIQHKDTNKAAAAREALAVSVIDNVNSAQGIARVVHSRAFKPWNKKEERALVETFNSAVKKAGVKFVTLNQTQREVLIQKVASESGRSPFAVLGRLKSLGAYPGGARGFW